MKGTLLFVVCSFVLLISCDVIFVHVSGKEIELQGKWQMDNADSVFFNFQNNIFLYQIYIKKDEMSNGYGYYSMYGDTGLELRLLREYSSLSLDHLRWDTLSSVTGQDTIFKLYRIEKLTGKQLILKTNNEKINFHKF